jgi:hypothetical protein
MSNLEFKWWEEKVENVPTKKWIYKLICFFLMRKITYKELYVILLEINGGNKKDELNHDTLKLKCLNRIIEIYQFNNNKIPKEMEKYV